MDCPDTPEELFAVMDGVDLDQEPLLEISHDAIKRAAQRWDEFVKVTQHRPAEEVIKAGYVFAGALGLEGDKLDHAVEHLKLWTEDPSPHQGTMGLLFGLLIMDEAKLEREFGD